MVKSRYIGDGHPTFNRNPYNGYINPYYWVDDHPLLYGTIGSLDPSTYRDLLDVVVDITSTFTGHETSMRTLILDLRHFSLERRERCVVGEVARCVLFHVATKNVR